MIAKISFVTPEEAKESLEFLRDNPIPENKKPEVVEMIIEAALRGILRGSKPGETPLFGSLGLAGLVIVHRIDGYDRIEQVFKKRWETGDRCASRLVGFDRVKEESDKRFSEGDTRLVPLWNSVLHESPKEVTKVNSKSTVVFGRTVVESV